MTDEQVHMTKEDAEKKIAEVLELSNCRLSVEDVLRDGEMFSRRIIVVQNK